VTVWADGLPNLLIGLREGLEGGLVVSILLAAVKMSGAGAAEDGEAEPTATRGAAVAIWLGVAAALVLALSFGAVLTFYRSILSTTGQEALGGTLSVIAVVLVTGMIFWMRRTARSLSGELKAKVADALRISTAALILTAFLAVGREGVETALFLWTAAQASGSTIAPLIGAAVGIAIAVALCVLLYRSAVRIQLGVFFNRTAILLIVVAAGVFAYGLGDLQDAGWLPGHTWLAFDLSQHIDASSWWVTIISGVTNLRPTMTWLQVVAYVVYLVWVLAVFLRANRAGAPKPAAKPAGAPASADAATAEAATAEVTTVEAAEKSGAEPVSESAEKAAEQPAPAAEKEPALAGASRGRIAVSVGAAMLVPPVAAAALIVFAPGKATAADQQIDIGDSSCASGYTGGSAGNQGFTVSNKSGHTVEVNLVQASSQGIVAEIETLGPATSQTISANLAPGGYFWRCLADGLPTTTSATVQVTGGSAGQNAAATPVRPVTVDDLQPAADAYDAYVAPKLVTLAGQVGQLRTDIAAANIPAAQADWLAAQQTWEEVGAAYDSFGDLGDAIDGLPQAQPGGVTDPNFTGLHRLEYGLWHGQGAAELVPVADQLTKDIGDLQAKLPQITVDPTDMPIRAHEILEDALRDHLNGLTDEGAGAAYAETYADVEGTRTVLGMLTSLLDERAPKLLPTAYAQLATLEQALDATKVNGQWRSPADTPQAQRAAVSSAIGAALETLSDIPTLLETPAH
jgi:high-affinity iron transporter